MVMSARGSNANSSSRHIRSKHGEVEYLGLMWSRSKSESDNMKQALQHVHIHNNRAVYTLPNLRALALISDEFGQFAGWVCVVVVVEHVHLEQSGLVELVCCWCEPMWDVEPVCRWISLERAGPDRPSAVLHQIIYIAL
jgi:hypothetical protein